MFNRKVVFILGAGASCPYGFPDGRKLIEDIKESLEKNEGSYIPHFGEKPWRDFQRQLKLSGTSSIDEFLTNNPKHDAIGRYSIVFQLMYAESEHKLMSQTGGAWYPHLFDALKTGVRSIDLKPVSFITFNYDRSLEHYLWLRLTEDYGLEFTEASMVMDDLQIVHIHGQMGRLPWQDSSVSEVVNGYEKKPEGLEHIAKVSTCLRIIHEAHEQTTVAGETACSLIEEAEAVFFLGFGFSRENMEKIGFRSGADQKRGKNIAIEGSAMGWTPTEIEDFKRRYPGFSLGHPIHGSIEYLRNSQLFYSSLG